MLEEDPKRENVVSFVVHTQQLKRSGRNNGVVLRGLGKVVTGRF